MRPLQLAVPTEEQLTALEELYRTTRQVRMRTRAQMVLLAIEQHLTAPAIATIVREDAAFRPHLAQTLESRRNRGVARSAWRRGSRQNHQGV